MSLTSYFYVNSHEKASTVRDTSKQVTLEVSILQRLRASKNMVVILSDKTLTSRSMLSFEIEKAVDIYELPLIITHTGYNSILNPFALPINKLIGQYLLDNLVEKEI
jgi:hypothetical protein